MDEKHVDIRVDIQGTDAARLAKEVAGVIQKRNRRAKACGGQVNSYCVVSHTSGGMTSISSKSTMAAKLEEMLNTDFTRGEMGTLRFELRLIGASD